MSNLELYNFEGIVEENEEFVIDTDAKADWAVKIIQKETINQD